MDGFFVLYPLILFLSILNFLEGRGFIFLVQRTLYILCETECPCHLLAKEKEIAQPTKKKMKKGKHSNKAVEVKPKILKNK